MFLFDFWSRRPTAVNKDSCEFDATRYCCAPGEPWNTVIGFSGSYTNSYLKATWSTKERGIVGRWIGPFDTARSCFCLHNNSIAKIDSPIVVKNKQGCLSFYNHIKYRTWLDNHQVYDSCSALWVIRSFDDDNHPISPIYHTVKLRTGSVRYRLMLKMLGLNWPTWVTLNVLSPGGREFSLKWLRWEYISVDIDPRLRVTLSEVNGQ